MSGRPFLLLAIVAVVLVSPAPLQAWQLDHSVLKRISIQPPLHLVVRETSADFDRDGIAETLILRESRATIQTGGQVRWQSPQTWRIEQAEITDLNHDGLPEVTLLVWRPFTP